MSKPEKLREAMKQKTKIDSTILRDAIRTRLIEESDRNVREVSIELPLWRALKVCQQDDIYKIADAYYIKLVIQ